MAGRPLIERLEMCSAERLGFEGCKDSVSCRQSVWPPKVIVVCDILAPEAANNPRGNIFVGVVKTISGRLLSRSPQGEAEVTPWT